MVKKKKDEDDFPPARIEMHGDTFAIVNDDTGEMVTDGLATRELAEQSALDHDFCIVTR